MNNNGLQICSLPELSQGQDWRLSLCHDRNEHLLIWITRGQGLALIEGQRRGVGPHNALFIPAGHLFALDLGRQSIGQAVVIPFGAELRLPDSPCQLRIRDGAVMAELTTLIEAGQREQRSDRALGFEAMDAYGALMSVWLRRALADEEQFSNRRTAAQRLSARFAQRVSHHFSENLTIGQHAEKLGVTATHLARACRAACGKSAAEILTERVLYEARTMLTTTRVPVQDVARHLGFGSPAYFTRFVQQHTHKTPSALRKAALIPSTAA